MSERMSSSMTAEPAELKTAVTSSRYFAVALPTPDPFSFDCVLIHEGCGLQFRVHQSLESHYLLP